MVYPSGAVLAMLKLLKVHYTGEHKMQLSECVLNITLRWHEHNDNCVALIAKIDALIDSGTIGRMGGSGRLRAALMEISSAVHECRSLRINDVLCHVKSKPLNP